MQASRFHFVGSETWSNRPELLEGVNNVATDALTLGVETADLSAFDRYLKAKTRGSYRGNPWFDEVCISFSFFLSFITIFGYVEKVEYSWKYFFQTCITE